jgi:hypothetical protein
MSKTEKSIVGELVDYMDVKDMGIQISQDGQRVWVCVNGICILRVKGIKDKLEIMDDREG